MKLWTVAIWLPLETTAYENAAPYNLRTSKLQTRQRLKNIYVAEKRKVLYALATYLEQKEVSAAVAKALMLQPPGHQSARGPKRRKVNASDVDLNDPDIDTSCSDRVRSQEVLDVDALVGF